MNLTKAQKPQQSLVQRQDILIRGGTDGCTQNYKAGANLNDRIGVRPSGTITGCPTGGNGTDTGEMCRILQGATAILSGDFVPSGEYVNVTKGFTGTNNAGDVDLNSTGLSDRVMERIIRESLNPPDDTPTWTVKNY